MQTPRPHNFYNFYLNRKAADQNFKPSKHKTQHRGFDIKLGHEILDVDRYNIENRNTASPACLFNFPVNFSYVKTRDHYLVPQLYNNKKIGIFVHKEKLILPWKCLQLSRNRWCQVCDGISRGGGV